MGLHRRFVRQFLQIRCRLTTVLVMKGTVPGESTSDPAAEASRALHIAAVHAPSSEHPGLVHGDLCPENIVVDTDGNLRVIDTDSITLRAKEYDLARVWYRWPMTADQRAAFDEGYAQSEVLASYREHFLHWTILVLIGAAQFRLRHRLPGVSAPVHRLRDLLAACNG
jgi:aminoglycoside phosphotransferase (APT) family kinase protein